MSHRITARNLDIPTVVRARFGKPRSLFHPLLAQILSDFVRRVTSGEIFWR